MHRVRGILVLALVVALGSPTLAQAAPSEPARSHDALLTWHKLVLELVRHTATYSPPVAARAFAYLGVTAFEALATGPDGLHSLAGQLNELAAPPPREAGQAYDSAIVVQSAMAEASTELFGNTGPTGQRAMAAVGRKMAAQVAEGVPADIVARSEAYGKAVAAHVLAWARTDGGAVVENMGFPLEYELTTGPAHWVPTSLVAQQQAPLLPHWGCLRPAAAARL